MTNKPSFRQRWQYYFDTLMLRGTPALITGLFFLTLLLILLAAVIIRVTHTAPEGTGFWELVWMALMRTLDAGTMGGDSGSLVFLLVMFLVTLGGIFIVSSLIGVLSNAIFAKLAELQKGRSLVLEEGHIVLLGWSHHIFTVLSELVIANENQQKACLVVLANRDKTEMEAEIADRVERRGPTRIICRSGSPIDLVDLEVVNPHAARTIVVIPPEGENPDARVIKIVLALTNHPRRHAAPYHIVVPVQQPANLDVLSLLGQRDFIQPVLVGDLIARITAQTARQSGLCTVYTELLNFEGDEMYFTTEPRLLGKTYRKAMMAYQDSTVMGLRRSDGTVALNPTGDTLIEAGDSLLGITCDDDTFLLSAAGAPEVQDQAILPPVQPAAARPEATLILGWNGCTTQIVRQLDSYAAAGSRLTMAVDPHLAPEAEGEFAACCPDLLHHQVDFQPGDTTLRAFLDRLNPSAYDHVIVLSYRQALSQDQADSLTLVTLLHLRDIASHQGAHFQIVTEMLDLRNRALIEVAQVDDFIVSDHLVSLMMAQMAEDPGLRPVFATLFDAEGVEIYLKPVGDYVETGQPLTFYTLVEAAARRGQTALGYRLAGESHQPERAYGIHLNPPKAERVRFSPQDCLVVLAEA